MLFYNTKYGDGVIEYYNLVFHSPVRPAVARAPRGSVQQRHRAGGSWPEYQLRPSTRPLQPREDFSLTHITSGGNDLLSSSGI